MPHHFYAPYDFFFFFFLHYRQTCEPKSLWSICRGAVDGVLCYKSVNQGSDPPPGSHHADLSAGHPPGLVYSWVLWEGKLW